MKVGGENVGFVFQVKFILSCIYAHAVYAVYLYSLWQWRVSCVS